MKTNKIIEMDFQQAEILLFELLHIKSNHAGSCSRLDNLISQLTDVLEEIKK